MADLTELIVTLSRIQSQLRERQSAHWAYPDDPAAEATVTTLVMVLEARVQEWMSHDMQPARQVDRRHRSERRHQERRDPNGTNLLAFTPVPDA